MTDRIDVPAASSQAEAAERFETLYSLYCRRVAAYIASFLSRTYRRTDPDLVQDLAQDTWEQVWRSLARYDTARPAMPWLATIARRAVIAHFRLCRNRREIPTDLSGEGMLPASPSAADKAAAEEAAAVESLVRRIRQEPVGTALGVAA